jgi:hypothetical protein
VEKAKAAFVKRAAEYVRMITAKSHTVPPRAQRAGPSAEQMDLGEGCNHVVGRGLLSMPPSLHHLILNLLLSLERRRPRRPKMSATMINAGPKSSKPKSTGTTKPAAGKEKEKSTANVKTAVGKHTTTDHVF